MRWLFVVAWNFVKDYLLGGIWEHFLESFVIRDDPLFFWHRRPRDLWRACTRIFDRASDFYGRAPYWTTNYSFQRAFKREIASTGNNCSIPNDLAHKISNMVCAAHIWWAIAQLRVKRVLHFLRKWQTS